MNERTGRKGAYCRRTEKPVRHENNILQIKLIIIFLQVRLQRRGDHLRHLVERAGAR
jgi:hypothetical protein